MHSTIHYKTGLIIINSNTIAAHWLLKKNSLQIIEKVIQKKREINDCYTASDNTG